MARPRKSIKELPDNWRERFRELGDEGASIAECKAEFGVSNDGWVSLRTHQPEFADAEQDFLIRAEAWWSRTGRDMVVSGKGNATPWIFAMKNRFGWRDRVDHTTGGKRINEIRRRVVPAKKPSE